jgi:3-oxoacyl-[acyl-carrier-protein] synthase II
MNILGMGVISACGRGVDYFEKALNEGWKKPSEIEVPHLKNRKSPVYQVDLKDVSEKNLFKKMRRSDKLSKMAVVAASEAFRNSGLENMDKRTVGIIVATAFGAHVTTFNLLDDILDHGEAEVSPTVFSNSVHNAVASYISSALGIRGPSLTVTQFYFSFHYALQLSRLWLDEERCDYVLVGAAEQYGEVLRYIYDTKLTMAGDGIIRPFNFKPTYQIPGEGAAFFLVSKRNSDNIFCKFENILIGGGAEGPGPVDLDIIDTDGILADESVYERSLSKDVPVAAYSPVFGSVMTGSAFNCAAGMLMLKNQIRYGNPVKDNPHGLNILNDTRNGPVELIRCIRYNCYGSNAVIYLRKKSLAND